MNKPTQPSTSSTRSPDFIGIGAEKAGTTWLWEQLHNHPDIALPYPKELRFFAYRDYAPNMTLTSTSRLLQKKPRPGQAPIALTSAINELKCRFGTIHDYLSIFSDLPSNKIAGEISPQYASLSLSGIKQIHEMNKDVKILFIIRDPVERAISGAKMKLAEQRNEITEESITKLATGKHQLMLSDYYSVISNYRHYFRKEDLLILNFEDIANNPQSLLKMVCDFLGAHYKPVYFPAAEKKVFAGKKKVLSRDSIYTISESHQKTFNDLQNEFPDIVNKWREKYSRP